MGMSREEAEQVLDELMGEQEPCAKCKLHECCKSPFMAGVGNWYKPRIAVVGEAPGEHEDELDMPMAGPAGRMLQKTLEGLGFDMERDVWVTNSVRCRPLNGKVSDRAIKACRAFIRRELDAVQPDVVLTLGASPMFSLTEQKGIMSLHGHVHQMQIGGKETPVVHAFHPSFVLRDPSRLDDFCDDVERAVALLETGGKIVRTPVDYRIIRTEDDLASIAREISSREVLSWDIETTGVNAFADDAAVVCVSLSTAPNSAWLLLVDHDDADAVCDIPRERRVEWLRWALEKSPADLMGQNLKFDMGYIRATLDIHPRRPVMDVYIAHHLLDEEGSKNQANSLKVMARKYTDMGDYEQPAIRAAGGEKAFYSGMKSAPLEADNPEETMVHYACADADAVLRIAAVLMPRLKEENLLPVLSLEMHKTMMLTDLEVAGARIDWDYHASLQAAFPAEMDGILASVREFPQVALAERYHAQNKKKPTEPQPFNINSPAQVGTLVFDVLGLPSVGKKTPAGRDSTGKESVSEWLEMLDPGSDASLILTKIQRWKQLAKLNSGYVEPLPTFRGRDGKIHTRFNQGFVATWRLSSQDPNLQQLPRNDDAAAGDKDAIGKGSIKRMFIGGEPGWWVAEADYSQIELRTAGLISQDDGFIDNYVRGEDLHSRTACEIFGVHPDDLQKTQRTAAKTINFGILYGMDAPALARRLRITMSEAERMVKAFWTAYPGFDRWVKETTEFLREHHYVESMFGHRRHLPNVSARDSAVAAHAERQGFNFPIQCTASNLTMYAEMFINDILKEEGLRSYCFGQVHDAIWLTGPPEEQHVALTIVKVVMENPGFPFLIGADPRWPRVVPIVADVSVGPNLRDLQPWDEES